MKTQLRLMAFALGWMAACAPALADHPQPQMFESGIETYSDRISVGSSVNGEARVQGCATCAAKSYRMSTDTLFFIGSRRVTQAQFSAYIAGKHVPAMFFYRTADQVVSRIAAGK